MGLDGSVSIWTAEPGDGPLREITLGGLLEECAATQPDRPALIFDSHGVHWSYRDLNDRAEGLARGLFAWGIRHGDRVAVLSPNSPDWVLIEYALARIGAVLVTVNPAFRTSEIAYQLDQGRVAALLAVAEYRGFDIASALGALMPDLAWSDTAGLRDDHPFPTLKRIATLAGDIPGATTFANILEMAGTVDGAAFARVRDAVRPEDTAQIQYTSGTTGNPKGAMLSHRGVVNNAILMSARAGFTAEDRMVSAMPFFHTAGCVCNVIGMAAVGGCLIQMPAFDAGEMLRLIEDRRATIVNAVPTMLIRMLQHPEFEAGRVDVSSLRIAFTGGTTIPPTLMRDIRDRMGADPMIIMGMTECSPIITQTRPEDPFETRIATAGTPVPHTELKIVDENGAAVPLGTPGELLIRGYLVTQGYFDMPDRTAEAIDSDGWLGSGDLAVLDPGGYLRIVGRIKDMLIRGGENIYPAEIEDFLIGHPDVSDAQVVGVPDAEMGEEVFAFVIPASGRAIDTEALRDHCRQALARHKVPRRIATLDAFPQTANGKVRKMDLREMAAAILRDEAGA